MLDLVGVVNHSFRRTNLYHTIVAVDAFPTLARIAKQAETEKRRKLVSGLLWVVLLLAVVTDYLVYWPQSSVTQAHIEQTLNHYPVPPDTYQSDFGSGHKPHHGWATRVLTSARSPREVCDFYIPMLIAEKWNVASENCTPRPGSPWLDTDSGHVLLSLRREHDELTLKYYGYKTGNNTYRLMMSWGVPAG
jgi:hypothetical protein